MATEIRVPTLGESVTEATVGHWFKKPGDAVKADEPLVELETDKVTLEVQRAGRRHARRHRRQGRRDGRRRAPCSARSPKAAPAAAAPSAKPRRGAAKAAAPRPGRPRRRKPAPKPPRGRDLRRRQAPMRPAPSARIAARERRRPRRGCRHRQGRPRHQGRRARRHRRAAPRPAPRRRPAPVQARAPSAPDDASREERVRMTQLRQTIARRLKEAQNTAAMLTTFNDVDMRRVMELRKTYKDAVREEARRQARLHGLLREGLRAGAEGGPRRQRRDRRRRTSSTRTTTTSASRSAPRRASSCRWCATPTSTRSPTIEKTIDDFGKRARDGQLTIEEMQGGTFTITNGGIYGSLMSTPILNAPQSGILGMHRIEERPVVRERPGRGAADDVPGALLRPPHRRRPRGGDVPGARQGGARGPGAAACWICEDLQTPIRHGRA